MALRALAAIPLGYGVASLWAMALALVLPGPPAESAAAATLLAFLIHAGAAMWAFAAQSGWRATWTLLSAASVAAFIIAIGPPGA